MSPAASLNEALAAVAAKARALAEALALAQPSARVALSEPLQAVQAPPSSVEALLGIPAEASSHPKAPFATALAPFHAQISACQACDLGPRRKQLIFGAGDPKAPLVFLCVAPGPEEDSKGLPLRGAAGDLFDRMVSAMGYKRADVYVLHVIKCRAWGTPTAAELDACRPLLEQHLSLLAPKVLVAFGALAAERLLGASAQPWRGRWGQWRQLKVMSTHAPEEVVVDAGLKRFVWDDLKQVMQALKGAKA